MNRHSGKSFSFFGGQDWKQMASSILEAPVGGKLARDFLLRLTAKSPQQLQETALVYETERRYTPAPSQGGESDDGRRASRKSPGMIVVARSPRPYFSRRSRIGSR
jgi:hypothetical protein